MYDRIESTVPHSSIDTTALHIALDLGFLIRHDDGIEFSEPNTGHEYLIRHAANLALIHWDDLEAFTEALDNIQHWGAIHGVRREMGATILLILATEGQKDIVSRMAETAVLAVEAQEQTHFFWTFYHLFCETLPQLDITPQELPKALSSILQATANDLAGGLIFTAVEQLAVRSATIADALYHAFVAHHDEPVVAFAVNILYGLAVFDLSEAHSRALSLTNALSPMLRRVGIAALGRFSYVDKSNEELLQSTLICLNQFRATPNPETDIALVRAFGHLILHTSEAEPAIVEFAARSDAAVQHHVASVLTHHADTRPVGPWFKEALLKITAVPWLHKATFDYLDYCSTALLDSDPAITFAFIEAVVTSRDYSYEEDIQLPKMLDMTFNRLYQHHMFDLEAAITRWFASTDRRLHAAAAHIIAYRDPTALNTRISPLRLSKTILNTLTEDITEFVVERILGYVIGGRPLTALLLSALQRDPCSPALRVSITHKLTNYVLYNYPTTTSRYLKSRIEAHDAELVEVEVAQTVLEQAHAEIEARKTLPPLLELQPPSQHTYLLRLARQKQQSEIMEEARKHSVIMNLARRVPLKYGRAFFSEHNGAFSEPSQLSTFEQRMELPQGELIDPVGQAFQRMLWQRSGLSGELLEATEDTEQ